jgi:hypothetical protein
MLYFRFGILKVALSIAYKLKRYLTIVVVKVLKNFHENPCFKYLMVQSKGK